MTVLTLTKRIEELEKKFEEVISSMFPNKPPIQYADTKEKPLPLYIDGICGKSNFPVPPRRHQLAWSDVEKESLEKAFVTFVQTRALYHERTIGSILAYIDHNMDIKDIAYFEEDN